MTKDRKPDLKIGEIQVDDNSKIIFAFSEYQGTRRLDIRYYFLTSDGQWFPTEKGVNIKEQNWKELFLILIKVYKELKDYLMPKKNE